MKFNCTNQWKDDQYKEVGIVCLAVDSFIKPNGTLICQLGFFGFVANLTIESE